ncbi:MAG: hypothetical protein EZS28_040756 [Streblomastix strix]|uniref:Uncharacterized protein n=1 Tax=Streblomastix strix TaxID=222440 RepID=A0A5J4TZK7_9EUKA|nr:MAG: hypothetical protein EZS28_040756 [Streblomastix strix]
MLASLSQPSYGCSKGNQLIPIYKPNQSQKPESLSSAAMSPLSRMKIFPLRSPSSSFYLEQSITGAGDWKSFCCADEDELAIGGSSAKAIHEHSLGFKIDSAHNDV